MATGVAGWVLVLSEAQQAQQEGCKMINTRREGLSQRQGYPRLYSAARLYMKEEIQFGIAVWLFCTKAQKKEGKKRHTHFSNTSTHRHTFVPIIDCCHICSQDSLVMSFPVTNERGPRFESRLSEVSDWQLRLRQGYPSRTACVGTVFAMSEEKQLDRSSCVIAEDHCTEMCRA